MDKSKVCIFVDGENFRHTIKELFPNFDNRKYLPNTDWGKFFDWIAFKAVGTNAHRIRAYWYAVQNIDFSPFNVNSIRNDPMKLHAVLSKDQNTANLISTTSVDKRDAILVKLADELLNIQTVMEKRFRGWADIHGMIEHDNKSVEFRKAGSIRYDLFKRRLGSEKAVDVKLAIDLIRLKDVYDVAIILSGDQDYVPAVSAVKDFGKHTVNVAFKTQNGHLLPGGARRLNQCADWGLEISYLDLKKYLNL